MIRDYKVTRHESEGRIQFILRLITGSTGATVMEIGRTDDMAKVLEWLSDELEREDDEYDFGG